MSEDNEHMQADAVVRALDAYLLRPDEGRSRFITDPATGALVVNPVFDAEIEKALRREIGRIYRRQRRRLLGLKFRYFVLSAKCLALKARALLESGVRHG